MEQNIEFIFIDCDDTLLKRKKEVCEFEDNKERIVWEGFLDTRKYYYIRPDAPTFLLRLKEKKYNISLISSMRVENLLPIHECFCHNMNLKPDELPIVWRDYNTPDKEYYTKDQKFFTRRSIKQITKKLKQNYHLYQFLLKWKNEQDQYFVDQQSGKLKANYTFNEKLVNKLQVLLEEMQNCLKHTGSNQKTSSNQEENKNKNNNNNNNNNNKNNNPTIVQQLLSKITLLLDSYNIQKTIFTEFYKKSQFFVMDSQTTARLNSKLSAFVNSLLHFFQNNDITIKTININLNLMKQWNRIKVTNTFFIDNEQRKIRNVVGWQITPFQIHLNNKIDQTFYKLLLHNDAKYLRIINEKFNEKKKHINMNNKHKDRNLKKKSHPLINWEMTQK
ncbi:hypothetical protein M0812_26765 [Anaeramoeba flamelloides]|uniref:FCP1 homology domain-containing protein n=1 Tax=Anaeramoeba flamelloides TaxID=1746091 RepID=A0AAV7YF99_9EUKA|nr:hypothetical protein M0812_26765 [Anaeramoeba flamelloides]